MEADLGEEGFDMIVFPQRLDWEVIYFQLNLRCMMGDGKLEKSQDYATGSDPVVQHWGLYAL